MKNKGFKSGVLTCLLGVILVFGLSVQSVAAQKVAKEKKFVLEWLSQPQIVEKFGRISDSIWSYAELGLQEYRSRIHSRTRLSRYAHMFRWHIWIREACDRNPG